MERKEDPQTLGDRDKSVRKRERERGESPHMDFTWAPATLAVHSLSRHLFSAGYRAPRLPELEARVGMG